MDFTGVSHHFQKDLFVTAGPCVEVWDHQRSEPINQFQWGTESVQSVRFNPVRSPATGVAPPPLSLCRVLVRSLIAGNGSLRRR